MTNTTVEPVQTRRLPVKSVISVQRHADGSVTRVVVAEGKRGPRVTKKAKKLDKSLRKLVRAQNIASSEYLRRHKRSNLKKRNGAVRELPRNAGRSIRKGLKSI